MLQMNGWLGTREEYLDDVCQCRKGLPDRACQDAASGGMVPASGCPARGTFMCLQDQCQEIHFDERDAERCGTFAARWGTDNVCQCGCTADRKSVDPDCFYYSNYHRARDGQVVGECTGVDTWCTAHSAECTPDAWHCALAAYADGRVCHCGCGAHDPDCDDARLPSDCDDGLLCVDGAARGVRGDVCGYPPGWTCGAGAYADGRVCHCGCGLADPDCVNASVPLIECIESSQQPQQTQPQPQQAQTQTQRPSSTMTCTEALVCVVAACGNGVLDLHAGEECDGGAGCDPATCRCARGYVPTVPVSRGCAALCGDGVRQPEEECDSTQFCTRDCLCAPGHEYNRDTERCAGCGNGVLDPGEECDGGAGCLPACVCDRLSRYDPASPAAVHCALRSRATALVLTALALLLATALAVWLLVILWHRGQKQLLSAIARHPGTAASDGVSADASLSSSSSSTLLPGQVDTALLAAHGPVFPAEYTNPSRETLGSALLS